MKIPDIEVLDDSTTRQAFKLYKQMMELLSKLPPPVQQHIIASAAIPESIKKKKKSFEPIKSFTIGK